MCGIDTGAIGRKTSLKLKTDLMPSLNPKKQLKRKRDVDMDFGGQNAETQRKQNKAIEAQQAGIDEVNAQTQADADAAAQFSSNSVLKKRRTLLTDQPGLPGQSSLLT